jgi:hypothetical protein
VHGADLGEPGDLLVHAEEAGDASRGRRVHHDGVVQAPFAFVLTAHRLACLARQQYVPQAGRDGRREVDRAELLQRAARAAQFVEHLEVVQEGPFGIYGEREDLTAVVCDGDLAFLVRKRLRLEELRDALPPLDLDEERAPPAAGQRQRECRGDRRLPGAALARDNMQPAHSREPNQRGDGLRSAP